MRSMSSVSLAHFSSSHLPLKGSVPESGKQGWQGGELGAGAAARARPGRHKRWPACSKQSNEVLHPDVRLPQNGPQCAPVQLSMCGDNDLRKWIVPPHNGMATVLAAHSEAQSLQRSHHLLSGDPWKGVHP